MSNAKKIHFLLRYSDQLTGFDTLQEHTKIIDQFGAVLMGKIGMGMANDKAMLANTQISNGVACSLFLMSGSKITAKCNVVEVMSADHAKDKLFPNDKELIPRYYRSKGCSVWFKLTSLDKVDVLPDDLRLYNDPALRPSSKGMRGMVYLTESQIEDEVLKESSSKESDVLRYGGLFD
tara:strand:+ start:127 stop:660 length:534 start_codon:yes stop_codon:yes gene_type:complete